MRYRFENFGGIIATDDPPTLAFVDRAFMRDMSLGPSRRWETDDESIGLLSAPTEVHFACTNACNVRCAHCYMDSGDRDAEEMDTETFKRALKALADMGVFHVALGGGEALLRGDLFELADYARGVGLVPNLTTSGLGLTEPLAQRMAVFGQVNVSLDGVGPLSATFRGPQNGGSYPLSPARDSDRRSQTNTEKTGSVPCFVDHAIELLLASGVAAGINCVLGRRNFDGLGDLFRFAAARGVSEIEVLRFKPAGRAADRYAAERTSFQQNVRLLPVLQGLSDEHQLTTKIDCSFVPMLCYHNPSRELLTATATYGCEAGNVLVGVRSDGRVSGCSFLPPTDLSVLEMSAAWPSTQQFDRWRTWAAHACEPCKSCHYLDICKGGCHAVSLHVLADPDAPDPDCPRVVEHARAGIEGPVST